VPGHKFRDTVARRRAAQIVVRRGLEVFACSVVQASLDFGVQKLEGDGPVRSDAVDPGLNKSVTYDRFGVSCGGLSREKSKNQDQSAHI